MNTTSSNSTIRISIGSKSNCISSHLTNLEGISCTSRSQEEEEPMCNPSITHRTSVGGKLTPRVLFVDDVENFGTHLLRTSRTSAESAVASWDGDVKVSNTSSVTSLNNPFDSFEEMASQCASSRYEVKDVISEEGERHMNWDDMGEEEDEEMEERKRQQKRLQEIQMDSNLSTVWEAGFTKCVEESRAIGWYDYLLPPYPPPKNSLIPISSNFSWEDDHGALVEHMTDSIRYMLEECDTLAGFQILSDADHISGYNATETLLEYIQEECKSARRLGMLVSDDDEGGAVKGTDSLHERKRKLDRKLTESINFSTFAQNCSAVIPLNIPLCNKSLPSNMNQQAQSLFHSTALASLVLDNLTLSYRTSPRFQPCNKSLIAYQNYNTDEVMSCSSTSFHHFVQSLQQFTHNIVELETGPRINIKTKTNTRQPEHYPITTSLDQILKPLSSNIPSIICPPRNERVAERATSPIYKYHSITFSSNQINLPSPMSVCDQIMENYRPAQCLTTSTHSYHSAVDNYAYWKDLKPILMPQTCTSVLSNSSRSLNPIQDRLTVMKKIAGRPWAMFNLSNGLVDRDDYLECSEFVEGTLLDYYGGKEDEEGDYFDCNED